MKAHNFLVRNAVQLDVGARRIDLRDGYTFSGFTYDVANSSVLLHWRSRITATQRRLGERQREDLMLYFEGVRCLHVERGNRTQADAGETTGQSTDDRTLAEETLNCIGYLREDVIGHWPIIMDEPPPDEWFWTFEFDSGCTFAIDAERVRAELSQRGERNN